VKWYATKSAGRGQGLVIDEADGRSVAVAYEETDAGLLAAAPELAEACRMALNHLVAWHSGEFALEKAMLRAALAKAEGRG